MGRADGSTWYYAFPTQGISGGATSTLIPLSAFALGQNLFTVGITPPYEHRVGAHVHAVGNLSNRLGRRKPFLLIGFVGSGSIFGPLRGGFSAGYFGYGPAFATSIALVIVGSRLLWAVRIRET